MILDINKLHACMALSNIETYTDLAEKAGVNYNSLIKAVGRRSFSNKMQGAICAALCVTPAAIEVVYPTGLVYTDAETGKQTYAKPAPDYFFDYGNLLFDDAARAALQSDRNRLIEVVAQLNLKAADYHVLMETISCLEASAVSAVKKSIERQQAIEARQLETLRGMAAAGLLDK